MGIQDREWYWEDRKRKEAAAADAPAPVTPELRRLLTPRDVGPRLSVAHGVIWLAIMAAALGVALLF